MVRSALVALAAAAVVTPAPVSRDDAAVRAFKVLLAVTERPADSSDATGAAITVQGCRRSSGAWLCRGSLAPVWFSGVGSATCRYLILVGRRTARVRSTSCG
jgi:hypothetical protein